MLKQSLLHRPLVVVEKEEAIATTNNKKAEPTQKSDEIIPNNPHIIHRMPKNSIKTAAAIAITFIIAALILTQPTQAQTSTAFSSADHFAIPTQNSTITFALNGSYTSATLQDGTWVFRDLTFNSPKIPYFDLSGITSIGDLNISAQNCNVTVWIYLHANYTYPITLISYYSDGGVQTVNLGLNSARPTDTSEWSVVTGDNAFLAEGQGWTLLLGDSLVINPPSSGNITVMYFDFNDPAFQESLPFWMQHSILLLTGIVLAVTVAASVLIRFKGKRAL